MENNKTQITAVIFTDAEYWLTENLSDLVADSVCSIYKTTPFDENFTCTYADEEENNKQKVATLADHVKALQLLCDLVSGQKLFVGGVTSPFELLDVGNWDAEVVDAFRQLIYHGEVIYG